MASDLLTIVSFGLFAFEILLTFLSPFPASLLKDKTADRFARSHFLCSACNKSQDLFCKGNNNTTGEGEEAVGTLGWVMRLE